MAKRKDRVMTMDELPAHLKIAKSTLYNPVQERRLPGRKAGRHRRFRNETVDRRLDQNRKEHRCAA